MIEESTADGGGDSAFVAQLRTEVGGWYTVQMGDLHVTG